MYLIDKYNIMLISLCLGSSPECVCIPLPPKASLKRGTANPANFGPTYSESTEALGAGRENVGPATVVWVVQCSTNEIV